MANRYFFQYLLNEGVLSSADVCALMPRVCNAKPTLQVMALSSGLVTSGQIADVRLANTREFLDYAKDKNLLAESQTVSLMSAPPSRDACLAQLLLDDNRLDWDGLEKYLVTYREKIGKEDPVFSVVMERDSDGNSTGKFKLFASYISMFVKSVHRFADSDAVILKEIPEPMEKGYFVSQSLSGGVILAAGVEAKEKEFLALGKRFSGEPLSEVDDLAFDCVAEFLNVLNGIHIVNLSNSGDRKSVV